VALPGSVPLMAQTPFCLCTFGMVCWTVNDNMSFAIQQTILQREVEHFRRSESPGSINTIMALSRQRSNALSRCVTCSALHCPVLGVALDLLLAGLYCQVERVNGAKRFG
jgi:hypothetical protein